MFSLLPHTLLAILMALDVEAGPLRHKPRQKLNSTSPFSYQATASASFTVSSSSVVATTTEVGLKDYSENFSEFFNSGTPSPIFSPVDPTTTKSSILKSKSTASSSPTRSVEAPSRLSPDYIEVTVLPDIPTTVTITPTSTSSRKTSPLPTTSTSSVLASSPPVAETPSSATTTLATTSTQSSSSSRASSLRTSSSTVASPTTPYESAAPKSTSRPGVTSFTRNDPDSPSTSSTSSATLSTSKPIVSGSSVAPLPPVFSSTATKIIVTLTGSPGAVVTIPGLSSKSVVPSSVSGTGTDYILPTGINSAPPSTGTVSPEVYAVNLDRAREFNNMFIGLNSSSTCTGSSVACIEGSVAKCDIETTKYVMTQCQAETSCYVLPLNTTDGVIMSCYKQEEAKSILGSLPGSPSTVPSTVRGTGASTESGAEVTGEETIIVTPTFTSVVTVPAATVSGEDYETVTYTPTSTKFVTAVGSGSTLGKK
ncbi:hypothetical protein BROUX41_006556 [Berkeleyomyces rouxiae]|uniref:uncharacterized protein n=1 Tax=Berkeleyomyces rouxiae TaxID=2035830 RepID=UPI003B7D5D18